MILVNLDVFVHVLAADSTVEQNVGQHGDDKPVGGNGACALGNRLLDEWHDTTTHNHCHEDTAGSLGVLAESLNRQVEDTTPHDTGAESAGSDEDGLHRHVVTTDSDADTLGQEDGDKQQDNSHGGYNGHLE